jgi:hypothetical protein
LSGQIAITGRTALRKQVTVRILQKAFSHITILHRQKPDLPEKLKDYGTGFSRECAVHAILFGFEVKAFRKFAIPKLQQGDLTPT